MRLQAPQEAAALPATRWMATTRAFFRQGGSTLALCPMVWVHVFLLMKYGHTGNGRRGIRQQVFLTCFSPKLSICCFIASLILQHVRHRFSFPIRQKVLFWLIRLCSCLAKATLRSIRGPTTEVVKESRKHAAQFRDAKKPYAPLLCDRKQRGQSFTKMSVKNGSIE